MTEQEHAAVAAPLAVAFHLGWGGELDVELHVGELPSGAQQPFAGGEDAALIAHVAADPSAICHALRSSGHRPARSHPWLGATASHIGGGVTIAGYGRVPSCTRHLPLGCMGVSS